MSHACDNKNHTLSACFISLVVLVMGTMASPPIREFRREERSKGPLPVFRKGVWGYIDQTGGVVVAPQFEAADFFYENRAAVQIRGHWGFIDVSGHVVIPPKFTSVTAFSGGLAGVYIDSIPKERLYGYIGASGELRFRCATACGDRAFSNGLISQAVEVFRCVDAMGHETGETYPCPSSGNGAGHAIFVNRWGYYDTFGHLAFPTALAAGAGSFAQGLAAAQPYGGVKFGYINTQGTYSIAPSFDAAEQFSEGLAGVAIGQKWGFIDSTGRFAIEPQFDSVRPLGSGYAAVFSHGRAGYIDKTGHMQVSLRFVEAESFSEGLAAVCCDAGGTGYIDSNGAYVIAPRYPRGAGVAGQFSQGVALVRAAKGPVYIDRFGQIIADVFDDSSEPKPKGLFQMLEQRSTKQP